MQDTKQLWEQCLGDIEQAVSRANYSTWFKNTTITRQENGTACIGVPNEFVKDWLCNKYHKLILKTLMQYSENVRAVEYTITRYDIKPKEEVSIEQKSFINKELPLQDLYINKEDNLNPRYIFESFIVGSFNELAFAAAQAIVSKPGASYNPFFIYGGTGLGKTHLIQGVGNAIKTKYPDKKVHYITLEKFATDLINSFQTNKANNFKEKYRKYDVLIIDDIQFVGKMEKTQEELFHTFNTFYESNRQIIFSSDKHPNYIPGLEDRLKSRFSAGMIVDITEPDYESRLAILRTKLQEQKIEISDEVLEYTAAVISGSIRELEGSLNAIICQTRLKNKDISMSEVKGLIKNNIKPKKNVSIDEVVHIISTFYNIDESSIYEKTRRKEIVHARQMIMYILREDFNVSYPLIGQKLGGKDHTTVIHSFLKIKEDLKRNPNLSQELEQIRGMFK
ncbi:chromosomal replication initiator protein DnaA [Candidatus Nomurabacteria bacterium]|jgi:chromosomal replication initiator protein|nr:MAG: chromosomal replication initiator protein DnaA [Candidatus Nomurabacteria bacterium]